MNSVITGTHKLPSTLQGLGKTFYLIVLGLVATFLGTYLLIGLKWNMWIVLPFVVLLTPSTHLFSMSFQRHLSISPSLPGQSHLSACSTRFSINL